MSRPFEKILIANRGEIACRVMRTCREMGVRTVAVASEADLGAPHARMADEVVPIGPPPPLESYLRVERILEAARETGAEAIHPGYGFLAENAGFARGCAEAGIAFIGPSPEVIERMGEKTAAREIMSAAGVPVVPGATLPDPGPDGALDADAVLAVGEGVGYPLLVKAAFGGGGKGMRLVREAEDLVAAVEGAAREAVKAFGDGLVYLERYIERPRHVEFQIFGDSHGHAVHLQERECSIQRRHQKIIEETPSPVLDEATRAKMGEAAVAAALAVGYCGAGTVEFLLAEDMSFYFLEMNTRLQVEHPVTELVTGLDLVRAQLEVAAGAPLPWTQDEITPHGHAIECRLYAEDPAQGFLPSLGDILIYREPDGPGVRLDSGIAEGSVVSMHYDPMLAKVSTHAETRAAAVDRMRDALRRYAVLGVTTNGAYLDDILAHPAFLSGETHTHFLEEYFQGWTPAAEVPEAAWAAVAAVEAVHTGGAPSAPGCAAAATSPWERLGPFRLNGLE